LGIPYDSITDENALAPTTDAAVATTLPDGTPVWAVGKVIDKPWIMVARDGKSIGYVHSSLLAATPQVAQSQPKAGATGATNSSATDAGQQAAAPFNLDADAPLRTAADLENLPPNEKADVVVASVMCRDIRTSTSVNGQTATDVQTACKAPDGTWELD
jgi:hypothetical protein